MQICNQKISAIVWNRRQKWFGHFIRHPNKDLAHQSLVGNPPCHWKLEQVFILSPSIRWLIDSTTNMHLNEAVCWFIGESIGPTLYRSDSNKVLPVSISVKISRGETPTVFWNKLVFTAVWYSNHFSQSLHLDFFFQFISQHESCS